MTDVLIVLQTAVFVSLNVSSVIHCFLTEGERRSQKCHYKMRKHYCRSDFHCKTYIRTYIQYFKMSFIYIFKGNLQEDAVFVHGFVFEIEFKN